MKKYNYIAALLCFVLSCTCEKGHSQAQKSISRDTVISIIDFGAIPNDNYNDNDAFMYATKWIRDRNGNCKLLIPKGTYLVGKQNVVKNKDYYAYPLVPIRLIDCSNVIIQGEKGTIIKFDTRGLWFGSFDPKSQRSTNLSFDLVSNDKVYLNTSRRAVVGSIIELIDCVNLRVENICFDGSYVKENINNMNNFNVAKGVENSPSYDKNKINIGGRYGDGGIQLEYRGISLYNSGNVILRDIIAKNFASDGIVVNNYWKNDSIGPVNISNVICDGNGRTGIVLSGGKNINIENSVFKNTGQFICIPTGTGMDIEPSINNKRRNILINVNVDKCVFQNNKIGCLLAKHGNEAKNVNFANCTFDCRDSHYSVSYNKKDKEIFFLNSQIMGRLPDGKPNEK